MPLLIHIQQLELTLISWNWSECSMPGTLTESNWVTPTSSIHQGTGLSTTLSTSYLSLAGGIITSNLVVYGSIGIRTSATTAGALNVFTSTIMLPLQFQ